MAENWAAMRARPHLTWKIVKLHHAHHKTDKKIWGCEKITQRQAYITKSTVVRTSKPSRGKELWKTNGQKLPLTTFSAESIKSPSDCTDDDKSCCCLKSTMTRTVVDNEALPDRPGLLLNCCAQYKPYALRIHSSHSGAISATLYMKDAKCKPLHICIMKP